MKFRFNASFRDWPNFPSRLLFYNTDNKITLLVHLMHDLGDVYILLCGFMGTGENREFAKI